MLQITTEEKILEKTIVLDQVILNLKEQKPSWVLF